jgi:DNA (cytosine-5)-methyltransferase 1
MTQRRLSFISLFSGAGGLDIGFEQAGWSCAYASDLDPAAYATLTANRGRRIGETRMLAKTFLERADIRDLRGREVLAKAGLRKGDALALVGGPPCQSWSSAGHQLGFHDPRGQLIRDYVRLAAELDVRWLVFENVRGLLTARGPDGEPGSALGNVRQALLGQGFQSEVNLLNAADYGVPQRRVRLFLIGFRRGDRPTFPEPTHSREVGLFNDDDLRPWVTLGQCLRGFGSLREDDIIRPAPRLARLLQRLPDGTGLKSEGKRESTRPGGHWGYRQGCFVADPMLPARTITASSQQDWIRDARYGVRRLSPRECAAIQTFPREWRIIGNRALQYRQIGNAVPPLLAFALANKLAEHVRASLRYRASQVSSKTLLPLPAQLESAITYTRKEEMRNGASRRAAPSKRLVRISG